MLKLKQNIIPDGNIDGNNKIFKVNDIIGAIQSIYVDGNLLNDGYTFKNLTITLNNAPNNSIVVNYFYREVSPISGNGMITLGDLKMGFYRKIGRVFQNGTIPETINKIYPEDYVKSELRKSYKRILNKSPEKDRIQQYAIKSLNGFKVIGESMENTITLEQSLENEIQGMFLVGKGVAYDYYNLDGNKFQVKDVDISEIGDKIIIGHRIPYGVQKVSSIYINGIELDYIDERDFGINTKGYYTIIKDWQGNEYLFLPYEEEEKIIVVKYIVESNYFSDDNDIINIPEEYMDVIIYDTAYRLLQEKEDERWIVFKNELGNGKREGLLYEFQSFIKNRVKNNRAKIGFASTYK